VQSFYLVWKRRSYTSLFSTTPLPAPMRMVTYGALLLYFVIFICHFLKDGPQNITYIQQVVMQNRLSAPTGDTKWVEGLKYLATVL